MDILWSPWISLHIRIVRTFGRFARGRPQRRLRVAPHAPHGWLWAIHGLYTNTQELMKAGAWRNDATWALAWVCVKSTKLCFLYNPFFIHMLLNLHFEIHCSLLSWALNRCLGRKSYKAPRSLHSRSSFWRFPSTILGWAWAPNAQNTIC